LFGQSTVSLTILPCPLDMGLCLPYPVCIHHTSQSSSGTIELSPGQVWVVYSTAGHSYGVPPSAFLHKVPSVRRGNLHDLCDVICTYACTCACACTCAMTCPSMSRLLRPACAVTRQPAHLRLLTGLSSSRLWSRHLFTGLLRMKRETHLFRDYQVWMSSVSLSRWSACLPFER
jgi:hypothetical protein